MIDCISNGTDTDSHTGSRSEWTNNYCSDMKVTVTGYVAKPLLQVLVHCPTSILCRAKTRLVSNRTRLKYMYMYVVTQSFIVIHQSSDNNDDSIDTISAKCLRLQERSDENYRGNFSKADRDEDEGALM